MFYVDGMSDISSIDVSQNILVIAGPTASGKSAIAMDIAQKCNSVIINADSMQVYSDLQILTARPTHQDMETTPHALYGVIDGSRRCNVRHWLELATREVEKARLLGKLPILVGGTGLYLNAARHGISQIPEVSEEIHNKAVSLHQDIGARSFKELVEQNDSETASRLAEGDSQRLIRAMEVYWQTNKPLSYWQSQPLTGAISGNFIHVAHLPPRQLVYDSINQRVHNMIEEGALDEVGALVARTLDPALPVMKALGVRQIAAYLKSELAFDLMIESIAQDTRHYAKRQFTWFKNNFISEFTNNEKYSKRIISEIFALIPR